MLYLYYANNIFIATKDSLAETSQLFLFIIDTLM